MAFRNAQEKSGTNLGHAANNLVGMIYNFIKFVFTALFCVISFFVCGLYKLCKKEKQEEVEEVENGKKKQANASSARKKIDP
jgi:Na+/melibiose symporter-like transporter